MNVAIPSPECWPSSAPAEEAAIRREFTSSSSSSSSELSDDGDLSLEQDVATIIDKVIDESTSIEENCGQSMETRHVRSMSDGSATLNGVRFDEESFEVFPSLPDAVLEKLGLKDAASDKTDGINEEELEQKFIALSLAFTIDAATISNRCGRQRRYRDQTETNLHVEIERLVEKALRLRPLCVDGETTELLTTLLDQVHMILRAADHAAISAERYGAVQHEARLASCVQLMINHVHALKAQRDAARRQLQYTKRVLQDPHTSDGGHLLKPRAGHVNIHQSSLATKRRASIATISQPMAQNENAAHSFTPKMARRTSDLTLRGGILTRSLRPTRLELGLDLLKMRQNTKETHMPDVVAEENEEFDGVDNNSLANEETNEHNAQSVILQELKSCEIFSNCKDMVVKVGKFCEHRVNEWIVDGASSNFFYLCALFCFSLSIISLGNVLIQLHND